VIEKVDALRHQIDLAVLQPEGDLPEAEADVTSAADDLTADDVAAENSDGDDA
jgi:hypothetical protein